MLAVFIALRRWRKQLRGLSTLLFGEIGELVAGIAVEVAGLAADGTRPPPTPGKASFCTRRPT
jgi:hypothetical protein